MKWIDFTVTAPASTANLGPGFDSIGLALDLQLTIHVSHAEKWHVEYCNEGYNHLSGATDNLIVKAALHAADKLGRTLPPAKLVVDTEIPLGRGLGSSASAIAGGIEICSRLLGIDIPMEQKVAIGTELEGHPDNISAAIMGGLTISYAEEMDLEVVHIPKVAIGVVMMVPAVEFLTTESRELLPDKLPYQASVQSSAAANVLTAALMQKDWQMAGRMMEKDAFHEPFRQSRFPDFDKIRKACHSAGAYGSAISGAGPSLFVMVPEGREQQICSILSGQFPHYECSFTKPSAMGIRSFETVV